MARRIAWRMEATGGPSIRGQYDQRQTHEDGGWRCQQPGCTRPVANAAGSVNCMLCLRRAQLDDAEEGAPPQSDAGQATAARDDSCSTVAWEEPGEEVMQEL